MKFKPMNRILWLVATVCFIIGVFSTHGIERAIWCVGTWMMIGMREIIDLLSERDK